MPIPHDYYGYDQDYEEDEPTGRCEGTPTHGCGRFIGSAWLCARCEAELRGAWRAERAEEASYIARLEAAEEAWRWDDFDVTEPVGFDGDDLPF